MSLDRNYDDKKFYFRIYFPWVIKDIDIPVLKYETSTNKLVEHHNALINSKGYIQLFFKNESCNVLVSLKEAQNVIEKYVNRKKFKDIYKMYFDLDESIETADELYEGNKTNLKDIQEAIRELL